MCMCIERARFIDPWRAPAGSYLLIQDPPDDDDYWAEHGKNLRERGLQLARPEVEQTNNDEQEAK